MEFKEENGKLVIDLIGRIDTNNATQVGDDIDAEIKKRDRDPGDVIFDADKLEYISSAGLRVLMRIRKQAGKPIPVINTSNEVYDIFETTGFTELMDVQKRLKEISVDGLDIVGRGGNGTVYRLDDDKIVKLYNGSNIDIVKREKEYARTAFVAGIPTVIPYDIVKCGDNYGIVLEMAKSDTLGHVIAANPDKLMDYVDQYVELAKSLHDTHIESGKVPDIRDLLRERAHNLGKWCTDDEIKELIEIIDKIPECDTILHNDLHPGNIMIQDGEPVLIDLAEVTVGPKVFDLSSIFRDMISGVRTNPKLSEMTVGMPVDMIEKVGQLFFMKYTGISDPDGLKEYFDRLGLIYSLNVVLFCGAGVAEVEPYAQGIMDRLKPVVLSNKDAIPQLIAALSQ